MPKIKNKLRKGYEIQNMNILAYTEATETMATEPKIYDLLLDPLDLDLCKGFLILVLSMPIFNKNLYEEL